MLDLGENNLFGNEMSICFLNEFLETAENLESLLLDDTHMKGEGTVLFV